MNKPILEVKDLQVCFKMYKGEIQAVRGVSFTLHKGEVLAVVGESGCGKSVMAQTIMRLIPTPPGFIKAGSILFDGKHDITKHTESQMQRIRGAEMGMIFQDSMASLNPTMAIGEQIAEGIRKHQRLNRKEACLRSIELIKLVGISNPEERLIQYPHELSGGMRQRVMIAIALACTPKLLIADEPTTALDVTIQAQIMELLRKLQQKTEAAILLITHDLGVVAEMAHRVIIMYAGKIVEQGNLTDIYYTPRHPYTWGLLRSLPRLDQSKHEELVSIPGSPPDLFEPPKGCAFAARCPHVMRICIERDPAHFQVTETHSAACWLMHEDAPRIERPMDAGGRKYG